MNYARLSHLAAGLGHYPMLSRAEQKESQRLDEGVPRTSDFDDPGLKRIESASPIALAESHFTEKHEMCHFFARLPARALTI
jgi:hypothetical protein